MYALLLTAEDRAGNIQTARRYLIFDNVNVVTINRDSDKQLFVDSAAKNTTYTWVTSLQAADHTGVQASGAIISRTCTINIYGC